MANVKVGNQTFEGVEAVKLQTTDGGEAVFTLGGGAAGTEFCISTEGVLVIELKPGVTELETCEIGGDTYHKLSDDGSFASGDPCDIVFAFNGPGGSYDSGDYGHILSSGGVYAAKVNIDISTFNWRDGRIITQFEDGASYNFYTMRIFSTPESAAAGGAPGVGVYITLEDYTDKYPLRLVLAKAKIE